MADYMYARVVCCSCVWYAACAWQRRRCGPLEARAVVGIRAAASPRASPHRRSLRSRKIKWSVHNSSFVCSLARSFASQSLSCALNGSERVRLRATAVSRKHYWRRWPVGWRRRWRSCCGSRSQTSSTRCGGCTARAPCLCRPQPFRHRLTPLQPCSLNAALQLSIACLPSYLRAGAVSRVHRRTAPWRRCRACSGA